MIRYGLIMLLFFILLMLSFTGPFDWGFYGHRLINRMAVYTLPPEMMHLYKPNLEFISEHAVDPDKRRYASPFEASRHYIDLDRWGTHPYLDLPRNWTEALIKYSDIIWKKSSRDSVILDGEDIWRFVYAGDTTTRESLRSAGIRADFIEFFSRSILTNYYDDSWEISCSLWKSYLELDDQTPCVEVRIIDSISEYGILPYHLVMMQRRLTKAFIDDNKAQILRISSEMGHYIGDAHVPLHTTENYNGQLTDQVGIHAFWESRIPELFAESEYDFFVGKVDYIADPTSYYWTIVLESNALVDSVLLIEKKLSQSYPSDQQYCFDERLQATVRVECQEYARAYQTNLSGMVEERMRQSIRSIGSAWYTAWIDAGQPDLKEKSAWNAKTSMEEALFPAEQGRLKIRKHE